jgi:hypothetical protein
VYRDTDLIEADTSFDLDEIEEDDLAIAQDDLDAGQA